MKKIVAIMLMVAVAASAYTQNANERLRQLEAYLQELGFEVRHSQSNSHRGITHYWYSPIDEYFFEDMDSFFNLKISDSIRTLRRQNVANALDSIRITFALLGKEATESYMYEYHRNDTDTIKYTLAFRQDEDIKRIPQKQFSYGNSYGVNAREVATFEYDRGYVREFDLGSGYGSYNHTVSTPSAFSYKDMQPFDIAAFEAQIQPAMDSFLKMKGAKTYPVYWRHDEGYEAGEEELLEKSISITVQIVGEPKEIRGSAGLTTGTHYVIPLKYEAEINALLQQLDSLTYNYIEKHPEQAYYYNFNSHISLDDEVIGGPDGILQGYKHRDGDEYRLSYYTDIEEENLHLLSITTKGDYWLPYDWTKLKSYINGEKVYLKGMKPKAEK